MRNCEVLYLDLSLSHDNRVVANRGEVRLILFFFFYFLVTVTVFGLDTILAPGFCLGQRCSLTSVSGFS